MYAVYLMKLLLIVVQKHDTIVDMQTVLLKGNVTNEWLTLLVSLYTTWDYKHTELKAFIAT